MREVPSPPQLERFVESPTNLEPPKWSSSDSTLYLAELSIFELSPIAAQEVRSSINDTVLLHAINKLMCSAYQNSVKNTETGQAAFSASCSNPGVQLNCLTYYETDSTRI